MDGKFAFGADEDLVVDRRLVVGKEIPAEELEMILFEAEVGKLMERMYRLFSIRQRSEKEVRDYIRRLNITNKISNKGEVSGLVLESLTNKLKQKGMLDDKAFALAWVDARRKSKKMGNRALSSELFQKGIDREVIEEVVSSQSSVVSQEELAEQALGKKLKLWKKLPDLEFKKKATEFLLRKGFSYSEALKVIDKFLKIRYNNS